MTAFLLDINVLIALLDPAHVFHRRALTWFISVREQGWATCPITENGVLRIMAGRTYPKTPGNPAVIAGILKELTVSRGHVFFLDDISILTSSLVDYTRLMNPKQITDTYLLALAVSRSARLATFDERLDAAAVTGGLASLFLVP